MPVNITPYLPSDLEDFTKNDTRNPSVTLKQLVGVPFTINRVVTTQSKKNGKPMLVLTVVIDTFPLDEDGNPIECVVFTQSQAMMKQIYNVATQVGKLVTPKDTLVEFTPEMAPHLTVEESPTGFGHVFQAIRSTRVHPTTKQPLKDVVFDYESYSLAQAEYAATKQAGAGAGAATDEAFPF
jgi:hypothetical protein